MFFTEGKRYLAVWGLIVLLLSFVLFGCGAKDEKGNTSTNINIGTLADNFAPLKEAGYYSDLRIMPNGEFLVRGKFKDEDANKGGLVYKVEMNNNHQISEITAMDSGKPIDTHWLDTLNHQHQYMFAIISMEYQDGYVKYSFKRCKRSACNGLYRAYFIRYKYDEKTKKPIIAYLYNKNGEQRDGSKQGFAQMLFMYDDTGNLMELGYSNKNGERIVTNDKQYAIKIKYDADKKTQLPVEVMNYGKDGALMADANGIAKTTYTYDSQERVIEVRHYGTDENLKVKNSKNVSGIGGLDVRANPLSVQFGAITRYKYNDNNDKPGKVAFYGKGEQPIALNDEYPFASLVYTYTDDGRIETVSSFGTDDLPCTARGRNFVKYKYTYDEYGNVESIIYYGKDNNIVLYANDSKAAIRKRKYDDKRQVVEISYWGTDGEPVQIQPGASAYRVHRQVYEYSDDGHRKYYYYDKNGKKVYEGAEEK